MPPHVVIGSNMVWNEWRKDKLEKFIIEVDIIQIISEIPYWYYEISVDELHTCPTLSICIYQSNYLTLFREGVCANLHNST